jgi:hypothetical protein
MSLFRKSGKPPKMATCPNSRGEPKIHCNQCRQKTNHQLLVAQTNREVDEEQDFWWRTTFETFECAGCGECTLRRELSSSEDEGSVTYYPPRASRWLPKWQNSLSPDLRELLVEIYAALQAGSQRLAMMGARTVIEVAMVSKVGDHGTFPKNLQAFQDGGFVSATDREYLATALDAGSATAHRGHLPSLQELDTVIDIVENLLHSVFVLGTPTAKLKARIPIRPATQKAPVNKPVLPAVKQVTTT